ncbi:MAG: class I SAM-dependent methyltransferase [Desulfobacterales bacterium]|nr:class I SAM-dependent methyltransferase [Desulfobacterales bacterium]
MSNRCDQKRINEIEHGRRLSTQDTETVWGWGTPAGQIRAKRRGQLLIQAVDLKANMRILEIGCGTGLFTKMLASTGAEIVAMDISSDLLRKAKDNLCNENRITWLEDTFETCNLTGKFDAIVGSSVLHHLDVDLALKKIFLLLKSGGRVCFCEPNAFNPQIFITFSCRFLFPSLSPDENPFYRWRLKDQLHRSGFINIEITPYDWLHPYTPEPLIPKIKAMGNCLERTTFINEFAGSLWIRASHP